jgi:hypothetical protein
MRANSRTTSQTNAKGRRKAESGPTTKSFEEILYDPSDDGFRMCSFKYLFKLGVAKTTSRAEAHTLVKAVARGEASVWPSPPEIERHCRAITSPGMDTNTKRFLAWYYGRILSNREAANIVQMKLARRWLAAADGENFAPLQSASDLD